MSLLLLTLSAALVAEADAWTAFLGPPDAELALGSLPVEWSPDSVAYAAPIEGYGQSSPVVYDGLVYVTSVEGENKEINRVSALDLATGEKRWAQSESNPTPETNNLYVSRAAPTPVADASGVVALFEGGRISAYTPTGELRWTRDLVADYGPIKASFGIASSLVQNASRVFAHVEREGEPYLLAMDKASGETVWKVPGFGSSTWASPMFMDGPDGKTQLVVSALGLVGGFDPDSGEKLWTLDGLAGNRTPTPYPVGGGRFLIGGSGGRENPDADATNGLAEIVSDGDSEGGGYSARLVWEAKKARSSFGTPIAADGVAYFVNRSGVLFAHDLETGEPVYTERLGESVWATPLAVGDRIYFVGSRGETVVVRTGREFEEIARNRVWPASEQPARFGAGPVQYAVAAVRDTLLIRAGDTLYAIRGE